MPYARVRAGRSRMQLLLLALFAVLVLPATAAQAAVPTHTFNYTGAVQQWTVPAGVSTVTIRVIGASGGTGCGGIAGGKGAQIDASVGVTPGEVLDIVAGGLGTNGCSSREGGWGNGLYDGGYGGTSGYNYPAAGGGAASVVSTAGSPIIVAGGGGGAPPHSRTRREPPPGRGGRPLQRPQGGPARP